MNVAGLSDTQLDYWVAKAEGIEVKYSSAGEYWRIEGEPDDRQWLPHRDWAQAGPIMEREGIGFFRAATPDAAQVDEPWVASDAQESFIYCGTTPLVAAMRAYVASKFGEELPEK